MGACSTPFHCKELDGQDRCMRTDHILVHNDASDTTSAPVRLVIYNLYIPNDGGQSMTYKMKFVTALRKAMDYHRNVLGYRVILVGDYNVKHRYIDMYYLDRPMDVTEIMAIAAAADGSENSTVKEAAAAANKIAPDEVEVKETASQQNQQQQQQQTYREWMQDVQKHWGPIQTILQTTKKVVRTQTTNPTTGETFQKYRLTVSVPCTATTTSHNGNNNGDCDGTNNSSASRRIVYLGQHEILEEYCLYPYDFAGTTYYNNDTEETESCRPSNYVRLSVMIELLAKLCNVTRWSNNVSLQHQIAAELLSREEELHKNLPNVRNIVSNNGDDVINNKFQEDGSIDNRQNESMNSRKQQTPPQKWFEAY